MHILTKIFAVLVAVLALLFAALTTTYSLNADAIVRENQELKSRQSANESSLRSQATERSEQIQALSEEVAVLRQREAALRSEIERLETERFEIESARREAEANAVQVTRQVGQLSQTIDTQQELIASYRDEVTDLRQQELSFRAREIELVDRLSDLESQNDVLDQTVRALQVALADANTDGGTGTGATASASAPFDLGGPLITGEVTRVTQDAGRSLAQVDLGESDGMRRFVRLYIVRDGEFVAQLVLDTVDLQSSVGVVDALGADVRVRPGDRVVSSLEQRVGG